MVSVKSVTYYSRSKISPNQVLADFPNPADLLGDGAIGQWPFEGVHELSHCPIAALAYHSMAHQPTSHWPGDRWRWRWDAKRQLPANQAAPIWGHLVSFSSMMKRPQLTCTQEV